MKNADYWRGRALTLEEAAHKQGMEYMTDLDREFKAASKRVQTELEAWYTRFAVNNQISLAEAKRWLTGRDLEEFRWTVQDYIKAGESLDPAFLKQLENASARVHISRLEALQLQIQQQMEVLYGNQLDGLDKTLRTIYREGYYHTAFEIQRGFSLGWDLQGLNEKQIAAVLTRPWSTDGQTFRDRCWKNKAELVNAVQTGLIQGFIRGDGPDKATKLIAERFRVSSNKAARLVMTESAYFAAQSQHDCYKDLDVGEFEVVETLDSHTCGICQGLDGAVFPMSDYEPGVTVPPFHPWCRGCTAPHFPDNYGERIARGSDGKTYFVPADMKYPDWYDAFVEGGSKANLTITPQAVTIQMGGASTVQEAQQEALKYANVVKFKGVQNIDALNELNGTLEHLTSTYPGHKLNELTVKINRTGRTMASANFEGIYPRARFMNDPAGEAASCFGDGWTLHLESVLAQYETKLEHFVQTGGPKSTISAYQKAIKTIKEQLKFPRYNVIYAGKEVQSVITHEYGHVLADQLCGQINHAVANPAFAYTADNPLWKKCQRINSVFQKAKATGDIHKISMYGGTDSQEFFAECFTIYDMGIEKLPDYIEEMVKEVLTP